MCYVTILSTVNHISHLFFLLMDLRIDFVQDLSLVKESWKIKVRIIGLWRPSYNNKEITNSLELVLLDDKVCISYFIENQNRFNN